MNDSARGAPLVVVALGGNAISPAGVHDTIPRQFAQTRETAASLADLLDRGVRLVVTHGNGPQVGSAVRRVELAAHEVYQVPLGLIVADLQGGMGYMIAQCLGNECARRGRPRGVTAIVTTVEIDEADPSFDHPTKPIGPAYPPDQAAELQAHGWQMVDVAGRGFQRVVPSPTPRAIVEVDVIKRLAEAGEVIVAAGGGGIPVVREADGRYEGREAVVDKDLASGLLARALGASAIVFVTAVDRVFVDYDTPSARALDRTTVDELRSHHADGQFPPGTMGPKIEATIAFLEHSDEPDARVIITDPEHLGAAWTGAAGTHVTR